MYSARNNVAHQFEELVTWKTLVTANPWNVNYLLDKNHVLVLFTVEDVEDSEVNKKATSVFVSLNGHLDCRRTSLRRALVV